jgi:cell division protein ZapA
MAEKKQPGPTEPTAVTIYGRTYHLRGSGDPSYLEELAAIVDAKMHEVAEATGTADSLKVAILASLNIADEFSSAKGRRAHPRDADGERRVARMVTLLDEALAG